MGEDAIFATNLSVIAPLVNCMPHNLLQSVLKQRVQLRLRSAHFCMNYGENKVRL